MVPMLTITYYALIAYIKQVIGAKTPGRKSKETAVQKKSLDNNQADVHSSNSAYRPRDNV